MFSILLVIQKRNKQYSRKILIQFHFKFSRKKKIKIIKFFTDMFIHLREEC